MVPPHWVHSCAKDQRKVEGGSRARIPTVRGRQTSVPLKSGDDRLAHKYLSFPLSSFATPLILVLFSLSTGRPRENKQAEGCLSCFGHFEPVLGTPAQVWIWIWVNPTTTRRPTFNPR